MAKGNLSSSVHNLFLSVRGVVRRSGPGILVPAAFYWQLYEFLGVKQGIL
jgi:hypothetical protein